MFCTAFGKAVEENQFILARKGFFNLFKETEEAGASQCLWGMWLLWAL